MSDDQVKRLAEQMTAAAASEPADNPYTVAFVDEAHLGEDGRAIAFGRDAFLRCFEAVAEHIGVRYGLSAMTTALVACLHVCTTTPAAAASILKQLSDAYPDHRREFDRQRLQGLN